MHVRFEHFSNMDAERYSYCWLLKVPESCGQDRTRWLTVPKLLSLRCFCSCFWNTLDVELLEPFFAGKNDQNDQHPQFHLWFIKVSWCKCKGNCKSFTQIALRTSTRHVPRCSSLVLWQFYGHVCVSFPLYTIHAKNAPVFVTCTVLYSTIKPLLVGI